MKLESSVDKVKATNRAKYGKDFYTQTDEYKQKVKDISLAEYGVEHYLQSQQVKDKRQATVESTFGVSNVFQNNDIKAGIRQTNLARYGTEYATQSESIKARIKENNIAKYGVEHPMQLDEYKAKAIQTNIERYGTKSYTQQHITDINKWYTFIDDPQGYINSNYDNIPSISQLEVDLGVERTAIDYYLNINNCKGLLRVSHSLMEDEIVSWIKEFGYTGQIIRNDRSVIAPNELDIYLPELNLAIECNPTATHNSSFADPRGGPPKHRNYHKSKTDRCLAQNIFLFHIFGYEWASKKDILKSMIANLVGANTNKIYARKCSIIEVLPQDSYMFLEHNHRQGGVRSSVNLGLQYNGELVALMTFGKMRRTIGLSKLDMSDCWELVRFCSKLNTNVIGGASKLFAHFVNQYNPARVRSFSDRAHTRGKLYSALGFTAVAQSDANYVWVEIVSDRAYHRLNAQKQNIKRFLHDDTVDLNKTEREIMIEHGYVQVYDSGTIT